ncbi:MAG: thymidine kinase [Bacteroidetes bacterium]|nr:thymidine kinase [Bacteroidota bacterium]
MFTEPHVEQGWIEVICGSMFSGKTEELIRRIKRSKIAGQKVILFKPSIDTRYHETEIVSHDSNSVESIPVSSSLDILDRITHQEVVAIDEAQFFDSDLPAVCVKLAERRIRVIVAGLDMDFKGKPFGPMPDLMAMAEYVTKVHAICMKCGKLAAFTFKKIQNDQTVELGERELYEARCRPCFEEGMAMIKEQLKMDL